MIFDCMFLLSLSDHIRTHQMTYGSFLSSYCGKDLLLWLKLCCLCTAPCDKFVDFIQERPHMGVLFQCSCVKVVIITRF